MSPTIKRKVYYQDFLVKLYNMQLDILNKFLYLKGERKDD